MGDTRTATDSRELEILAEVGRGSRFSQRELATRLGISVGSLNRMLRELVEHGFVRVVDRRVRPFAYRLTHVGERRRQDLAYSHYEVVLSNFLILERRIQARLGQLKRKGVRRVAFYGAGEIMEVTHRCADVVGLEVVGAVDDDEQKQSAVRNGLRVQSPAALAEMRPDAVIVTTFKYARDIDGRMATAHDGYLIWHL